VFSIAKLRIERFMPVPKHLREGYMKRNRTDPTQATIAIYLSAEGVVNVAVKASDAQTQTRAHELLAFVTDELRALHVALLAAGVRQELIDDRSRATLRALLPEEA
jgi:hypothetical protein